MRNKKKLIIGIVILLSGCLALLGVTTYVAGQSARAEMLAQNPTTGRIDRYWWSPTFICIV